MKKSNDDNCVRNFVASTNRRKKAKLMLIIFLIILQVILGIIIKPIKNLQTIDKHHFEKYNICNRYTFMDKIDYISNQQLAYYNIFDGTDENTDYNKEELIYGNNIDREYNDFEEYMTGKGWVFKAEGWDHGLTSISFGKADVYIDISMKEIRSTDYYEPYKIGVSYDNIDVLYDNIDETYHFNEIKEINSDAKDLLNSEENSTLKEFVVDINDYSEQACSKLEAENN